MRTPIIPPYRRRRLVEIPDKQLARWLDDGGAEPEPSRTGPAPVMWSPVALRARLEAENALRSLPSSTDAAAGARAQLRRICAQVDRREISQHAAIPPLRALTTRLRTYQRGLVRPAPAANRRIRHRVLATASTTREE